MDEKAQLLIGPDEKVPTGEAVLLGLQHVFSNGRLCSANYSWWTIGNGGS